MLLAGAGPGPGRAGPGLAGIGAGRALVMARGLRGWTLDFAGGGRLLGGDLAVVEAEVTVRRCG